MIRIDNIRLGREPDRTELTAAAAAALGAKPEDIASVEIIRRSIDARKKSDVHYVFSLAAGLKSGKTPRGAQLYEPKSYSFPVKNIRSSRRPVVVGMGPAGLFAALMLAEAGAPPLIIERGRSVERRSGDVESFFRTGALDPVSNVQFGEGGAGTFSDGKLATGISDARIGFFLRKMAALGAPEDIVYDSAPHVGTDVLKTVLKNAREKLLALGCEIRFESRLSAITIKNGALASAAIEHGGEEYSIDSPLLILAPGNGARDTFEMLHSRGVALKPKNFAVGVRIEHLQRDIDMAQYGSHGRFPPASY
ncbi:MAG: FAD-dependent monooxygenase, partial [Oscillospiraceae bacterium]|nr:FAD-dependent monooxygenase [Oscillospiraceae bacterium]